MMDDVSESKNQLVNASARAFALPIPVFTDKQTMKITIYFRGFFSPEKSHVINLLA